MLYSRLEKLERWSEKKEREKKMKSQKGGEDAIPHSFSFRRKLSSQKFFGLHILALREKVKNA